MRRYKIFTPLFIIFLAGSAFVFRSETPPPAPKAEVEWLTIEEALSRHQKEPRKIFVDVYTDWCGWCKRMDKTTFSHPEISEYLGEKFYAVKFDAERKKDFVTADTTFKFVPNGRRGYHEFAAFLLQGKMSYPTVVFLNEKLQMIQPVPGYMTAAQFDPILKYFGGNHYQKTPWTTFQKEYTSSIK